MKNFLSSISSKTSNKGTYMLRESWKSYMHEPYRTNCFQHSCTYETGISDFHKMTLTVLKTLIKKKKKIVRYRNYKSYDNLAFREEFYKKFSSLFAEDKTLN